MTALHMARTRRTAALLVAHGADVGAQSDTDDTPLHLATRHYSVGVAQVLVQQGASVTAKNNVDMTALHLLCQHFCERDNEHIEIANTLIQAGADVNARDINGKTALHYLLASYSKSFDLVKLLMSSGARLDYQDSKGYFPIHYFLKYFEVSEDSKRILQLLCNSKLSTNFQDYRGRSALHYLADIMEADFIQLLMEMGGDIRLVDHIGLSPLHCLSDKTDQADAVISTLLAGGNDINARDFWGRTPLMLVVDSKNEMLVETLIRHGAKVNVTDELGSTALHEACFKDIPSIVETLVGNGADINSKDWHKSTPLHAATYSGSIKSILCLVDKGVDKNAKDAEGRTALDLAIMQRQYDSVSILSDPGIYSRENIELTNVCYEHMDMEDVLAATTSGGVTRNGRELSAFLTELIESKTLGRGLDEPEAQEIQSVIETVIQTLARKIEEIDSNFRCTVLRAGSSSEGTKSRNPDEFDFMVCLEVLNDLIEVEFTKEALQEQIAMSIKGGKSFDEGEEPQDEIVSISDYTYLKVKDGANIRPFRPFLTFSDPYMQQRIPCCVMYEAFSDMTAKILFSKDFPKDPRLIPLEVTLDPAIEFEWRGSRYKRLKIDVDFVPAVRLSRWPDRSRRDCKLFTKDMLSRTSLAVPKMTSAGNEDLWRCSLALLETNIFRLLRPEIRNSYILCKCLLTSDIMPVVHFGEEDDNYEGMMSFLTAKNPELLQEDNLKLYKFVEGSVPSYVIKMTFLSLLEQRVENHGRGSIYDKDCFDSSHRDEMLSHERGEDESGAHKDHDEEAATQLLYGPALSMNVAQRSTDFDLELVQEVFAECERRLENRFVPSVFNPEQNILGGGMLNGGGVERALVFVKVVNCLLSS